MSNRFQTNVAEGYKMTRAEKANRKELLATLAALGVDEPLSAPPNEKEPNIPFNLEPFPCAEVRAEDAERPGERNVISNKHMKIKIAEIVINEGRRAIDRAKMLDLAESVRINGLINPITVNKNKVLIAGAYRLEACKHLGFDEIDCVVLDCDKLRSELAGIDENLIRDDLTPAMRVKAIKRREQILEALGLRKKPHGDGSNQHKSKVAETATLHTNGSIASTMGMGERTYRKDKQIGNNIADDALDTLASTNITQTDLEKIARLDIKQQGIVAQKLKTGEVKDLADYNLQEARKKHTAQSVASTKQSPPTLYIGDGIEWIKQQERCHLLLTDPPYSTDVDDIEAFANNWLPIALNQVREDGCAYIFVGAYPKELKAYLNVAIPEHLTLTNALVWHYKNAIRVPPKDRYYLDWQAILYFRGRNAPPINSPLTAEQRAVQEVNAPGGFGGPGHRYHTWQKPDELAERFVRHSTQPGNLVLDPFCCTGTFLVAASKLGRIGKGAEIDPENAKIAFERGCTEQDKD